MIKYFENGIELSENHIYYLVLSYGTGILDSYKQVRFSDCCEATITTRIRYKTHIEICSNCKKDI